MKAACLFIAILVTCSLSAQQKPHVQANWIDPSIPSCVEFDKLQVHYEAAFYLVDTPSQDPGKPGTIKLVENPQKLDEFMNWYGGGGYETLEEFANLCRAEMLMKDQSSGWQKMALIESTKNTIAGFFVSHIVKRYNGLVQDYNSLVKASQTYVQSSQIYIQSLESNNRQLRASRPVFVFPKPQTLNCTGDINAFSTSTPYPGSVDTVTTGHATINCQ